MGTKKTFITAAVASVAFAAVPTVASAAPSGGLTKSYDSAYERVVDAGGQPGRNIADDGVRKGGEDRPATSTEIRESLATLRSMDASLSGAASTGSATGASDASTTGGQAVAGASTGPTSSGSSGGDLSGVAACESGGNPGAVSPDGQYRGKYQFDQQTWESVGGSGDPAAAPEAEQDQRAQQLQAQRGSSPWPVCGG
ncbi:transglycosylase family protein [Patulibacter sp. NPDC049589]|uniref:transglycosylase family protein n=1 Tax=Patulibacter sp. NPDC049589 TaxID=3154731 RepID=UPI00342ABB11